MTDEITNSIESFVLRGEIFKGDKSTPATISGSYSRDGYDAVKCIVLPDDPKFNRHDYWLDDARFPYCLQLRGKSDFGWTIWIPLFRPYLLGERFEGVAELFVKGNLEDEYEGAEGRIDVYLGIPFTPLISDYGYNDHLDHIDGSITRSESWSRRCIKWKTSAGQDVEFGINYGFTFDNIAGKHVMKRIQNHHLKLTYDPNIHHSLREVVSDFWHKFDETMWILSLLVVHQEKGEG